MNKTYPYFLSDQSIILYKGSKPYMAGRDHANFKNIVNRIKAGKFDNIEQLFNIKDTLEKCFNITIKNGNRVYYKNKEVNNVVSQRIINYIKEGLPYRGWVCFLNKLMENPSDYCRDQLFSYVERYGLPIDDDGFIYAWKAVTSDYWDKHTGKTHRYKVGSIIKKDRKECDENPKLDCGKGLHCGAQSYVIDFGRNDGDKFVLVRFSPKDVISCPEDCSWQKLRLCRLRVMREVKKEEVLPLGDTYMGKNGKNVKNLLKRDSSGRFVKP